MNAYPYCYGPLLETPQSYMYSPYLGPGFISDWALSRGSYLIKFNTAELLVLTPQYSFFSSDHPNAFSTRAIIEQLCFDLRGENKTSYDVTYWLDRLLKKFEVSKRIYKNYSNNLPHCMIKESGFEDLNLYLLFAEALIHAWKHKSTSQYINGLLKLVDTLISQTALLNIKQQKHLAWVINEEKFILDSIMSHLKLTKTNDFHHDLFEYDTLSFNEYMSPHIEPSYSEFSYMINNDCISYAKQQPKILLLFGHTVRSASYVQALSNANITPHSIIAYGTQLVQPISSRILNMSTYSDLFSPNIELNLLQSLSQSQFLYTLSTSNELSSPDLLRQISEADPDIIIYSGYPGQLVPSSITANYHVLHIHAGWLPDFRGSTTLFYEIIEDKLCSTTAILLDEKIDTGSIVAQKHFAMPTPGMDVDHLYDNMIRADLLIEILTHYNEDVADWNITPQTQHSLPYYIIHPVLKHLAMLIIDKQKVDL